MDLDDGADFSAWLELSDQTSNTLIHLRETANKLVGGDAAFAMEKSNFNYREEMDEDFLSPEDCRFLGGSCFSGGRRPLEGGLHPLEGGLHPLEGGLHSSVEGGLHSVEGPPSAGTPMDVDGQYAKLFKDLSSKLPPRPSPPPSARTTPASPKDAEMSSRSRNIYPSYSFEYSSNPIFGYNRPSDASKVGLVIPTQFHDLPDRTPDRKAADYIKAFYKALDSIRDLFIEHKSATTLCGPRDHIILFKELSSSLSGYRIIFKEEFPGIRTELWECTIL